MVAEPVTRLPSTAERVELAKIPGDLGIFSKAVHNMTLEPYQLAWEEALNTERRVCIVCPPDTFKSTTVQHWVEREIGNDHETSILWLMNAGEQAEKRVMTVSQTIDVNTVYKQAFNVVPDKASQWTKSVLFVKREKETADPTLMGSGLNGPYQGLHFKRIIIDDPTNQEDVLSPTTMRLQESKIRGVILDRLAEDPDSSFFVILTRWGTNDLVPVFRSMDFTIIEMPVVSDKYPWGPTISNRRFPMTKIEQLRRDKGDALFQLTYMCNPSALGGNIIRRDHIRYYDQQDLANIEGMAFFMGVDPALSTKDVLDPSAIATVGLDVKTRNLYLLDLAANHMEAPDLEAEIVKRAKRTRGLRAVGVETVAFQMSIVQYLRRHHKLPLVELPYRSRRQAMNRVLGIDRDKTLRAAYLDSLFTSNRLFIPRNLPLVDGVDFETELCSIPTGTHDDRMDAVVFACSLADAMFSSLPKVALRSF